jgi:2,4-dienoyl-CoA reductase-like NADH-dependent reductase (Old Yellow Enzyme family)
MNIKEALLKEIPIGSKVCKNRFAINSVECNDADSQGNPTDNTMDRYSRYFDAGPGLIDLEAISITGKYIGRKNQLCALPQNEGKFKRFVSELKKINPDPLFIWQLTHAGETGDPGFSERILVKPVSSLPGKLLSEDDMDIMKKEFVESAKVAYNSGTDGIDLKVCHGFIMCQLLRPFNDRKWKYGGSFSDRKRFLIEVTQAIKKEIKDQDFLIGHKISIWEGFPGGFGTAGPDSPVMDLTEPLLLVKELEELGASFFIVSAGGFFNSNVITPRKDALNFIYLHQTFQKIVKDNVYPDTVVIGSAYSPFGNGKDRPLPEKSLFQQAADNIEEGICDMVAVGRQALADPYLAAKLEKGEEDNIDWCTLCHKCRELISRQYIVGCPVYNKKYTGLYNKMKNDTG